MTEPSAADRLVWVDLEMTGLDVERDVIVEIACIVTDAELSVLDEGVQLVVHQENALLSAMDDFVRAMHRRSGLLREIVASKMDVEAAETAVLEYVRKHVPAGTGVLTGNSIGVDRRFIAKYMPRLDEELHYRVVDVSSLKELCRRWYPEVHETRPPKAEKHRAHRDVLDSIEELRFYRQRLFDIAARSV
jgi:oligoribonuclease